MSTTPSKTVRSKRFNEVVNKPLSNFLKNGIFYIFLILVIVSFLILMLPVQQKVRFNSKVYNKSSQIISASSSGCFLVNSTKTYVLKNELIGFIVNNDSISKLTSPDSGMINQLIENNQQVADSEAIFILNKTNSEYFFNIELPQKFKSSIELHDTITLTIYGNLLNGIIKEYYPETNSIKVVLVNNTSKAFNNYSIITGFCIFNKVRLYKLII